MIERMMSPNERFSTYKATRELRISVSNHLRATFRDLVDPNDTTGKVSKEWLELPNRYLEGRRPVDILRGRDNSREFGLIHSALVAIDTSAFA